MILLPLLAAVAACWPSFTRLHAMWVDWELTGFTHGYVILAICVWLVWRDHEVLRVQPTAQPWLRLLPLFATALLWLAAAMAAVQLVELVLLPAVLWSVVLASCGWTAARRVVFPFAYFWLATPLVGVLNPFFQWTSIYAVRTALRIYGIPAYFDTNHVQIPEGTFEIAGGCSGLHFAVVGAAIALLLGELRGDAWRGRVKLALIALTLAMATNWVRIFVIILVGHYTHMQHYIVVRSHYGFGWAVFAVAMIILFFVERRMSVQSQSPTPRCMVGAATGGACSMAWHLPVLASLALLAGWRLAASRPASAQLQASTVPSGWNSRIAVPGEWRPHFQSIDEQRMEILSRAGIEVRRYTGLYRSQRQGKEIDGYDNDPLAGLLQVESLSDNLIRAQDRNGNDSLIATAYSVGGRLFAHALKAKLWYAMRALLKLRAPTSVVEVLRVECGSNCITAEASLREFREST